MFLNGGLSPLYFKNVSYKVVVFRKGGQIVMTASFYSDQCDVFGIECPQLQAMRNGYDEVFVAMKNIGGTVHPFDPLIGS